MQSALKSLPWVDQSKKIDADVKTQKVSFSVKDMGRFNEKELGAALRDVQFERFEVLSKT